MISKWSEVWADLSYFGHKNGILPDAHSEWVIDSFRLEIAIASPSFVSLLFKI